MLQSNAPMSECNMLFFCNKIILTSSFAMSMFKNLVLNNPQVPTIHIIQFYMKISTQLCEVVKKIHFTASSRIYLPVSELRSNSEVELNSKTVAVTNFRIQVQYRYRFEFWESPCMLEDNPSLCQSLTCCSVATRSSSLFISTIWLIQRSLYKGLPRTTWAQVQACKFGEPR